MLEEPQKQPCIVCAMRAAAHTLDDVPGMKQPDVIVALTNIALDIIYRLDATWDRSQLDRVQKLYERTLRHDMKYCPHQPRVDNPVDGEDSPF